MSLSFVRHEPLPLTLEPQPKPDEALQFSGLLLNGAFVKDDLPNTPWFYVLRKAEGCGWNVLRLEEDRLTANFQGNPLWPQEVLSHFPELARFFGLAHASSANFCIIPDFRFVNSRLDELLPTMHGVGSYRFRGANSYPVDALGKISDEVYVDRFVDAGEFPFADIRSRDSIHDWSYHFVTLLFPPFLDSLRANLEFIRDRVSGFALDTTHAWNYFGHSLDEDGNLKCQLRTEDLTGRAALYRQMAIALDSYCAKLVQLLKVRQLKLEHRFKSEFAVFESLMDGVTESSLRVILTQEPDITWMLSSLPRLSPDDQINVLQLSELQLTRLNEKALKIQDAEESAARVETFKKTLSQLEQPG